MLRTYADLLEHASRIVMGHGLAASREQIRTAIGAAYAALPLLAPWKRYMTIQRFTIQSSQTYTVRVASDGITVTISSGAWPAWLCAGSTASIAGQLCEVGSIVTSKKLLLSRGLSGVQTDVTAIFYNDLHELPDDYVNARSAFLTAPSMELHPLQLDSQLRLLGSCPVGGYPAYYTIEKRLSNCIRFLPAPTGTYQVDFIYHRSPNPLVYAGQDNKDSAGLVTVDGDEVTGEGTSFSPLMEGCAIRVSASATEIPTGLEGYNPYVEQRIVKSVNSTTSLTVTEDFDRTYEDVRYSITDILDVDEHLYQLLVALTTMEMVKMLGAKMAVDINAPLRAAMAADASQTSNFQQNRLPTVPILHGRIIYAAEEA